MSFDPRESFTDIGLIAHGFEQCEFELSEIFQLLCESENDAPFQIFGHVVSSNMRLGMTRVALAECLPNPSAIKTKLEQVFVEFAVCQTLRNRSVHQSFFTEIDGDGLTFIGRPLWHQTQRYKKGVLKPGLENKPDSLRDTGNRITGLVFWMRDVKEQLFVFLTARRERRLARTIAAKRTRKK